MRMALRLFLGTALLAAAMLVTVAPTFAAQTTDTIKVTCSNGFSRTVSANAANGVAHALTNFNAHNRKNVTCSAGPGAPRPSANAARMTVACTDGFTKTVPAKAANAIAKALNAYSARKNLGVTCSIA